MSKSRDALHKHILDKSWDQMMEVCPPKHHPPKPTNQTRMLEVLAVSAILEVPLMPHQVCMAAALTELEDNDKPEGRLRYSETLVLMPRQSGKSTVIQMVCLERIMSRSNQKLIWCSQKIDASITQFEQKTAVTMERMNFADKYGVTFSPGNHHAIRSNFNKSRLSLLSTTNRAIAGVRGQIYEGVVFDEACEIIGQEAEDAVASTMDTTLPKGASFIIASTAPLEYSTYLELKIKKHVKKANKPGSMDAYWCWSADKDADPADRTIWYETIPGLAFGTTDEKTILKRFQDLPRDSFKRGYLTIGTPLSGSSTLIPSQVWEKVEQDITSTTRPHAPIWLGVDADPDGVQSTIVAADSSGVVGVVKQDLGTEWVCEYIETIWEQAEGSKAVQGVVLLVPGPVSQLHARLRAYGASKKIRDPETNKLVNPVVTLNNSEFAVATQGFVEAITTGRLIAVHSRNVFPKAVDQARRRPVGTTGAFTIARKDTSSECSAVVAAAIALHAAQGRGWAETAAEASSDDLTDSLKAWLDGGDEYDDW